MQAECRLNHEIRVSKKTAQPRDSVLTVVVSLTQTSLFQMTNHRPPYDSHLKLASHYIVQLTHQLYLSHSKSRLTNIENDDKCKMCSSPQHQLTPSQSIPIPMPASHVHRTDSEVLLSLETIEARYRDRLMLDRLGRGGWGFRRRRGGDRRRGACCDEEGEYVRRGTNRRAAVEKDPRAVELPACCRHWSIEGFDEEGDDDEEKESGGGIESVPMSEDACFRVYRSAEEETGYNYNYGYDYGYDYDGDGDGFNHHDDEVFDLDL